MIIGIGTDICDIRRIEKSIDKFGDRFLEKTFTEHERKYCRPKSSPAGYFAKRFAAKEAVAKALATETSGALSWHDVEVYNDPSGRPNVRLFGEAEKRLIKAVPSGYSPNVYISLTDDFPYAQAFAVIDCVPVAPTSSASPSKGS